MYGWMWFSVSACFKQASVVSSLIHSFCRCTPGTATLTVAVTHSVSAIHANLRLCHITAVSPSATRRATAGWLLMEWKPRLPSTTSHQITPPAVQKEGSGFMLFDMMSVSTLSLAGGWRSVCCTSNQKTYYWSSHRTLKEDAIPSIFPFNNESWSEVARISSRTRRSCCRGQPRPHFKSPLLSY